MKVIRFADDSGSVGYGSVEEDGTVFRLEGNLFDSPYSTTRVEVAKILSPIDPPNIFAVAGNYLAHITESGKKLPDVPAEPVIFTKPTTSVIADGDPIVLPHSAPDEVDFEAELALIVGRRAKKVSPKEAPYFTWGFTIANDVSARDCQHRRDKNWTRGKGFDTFCPLGPYAVTADSIDPHALSIRSIYDNKVMQDGSTANMMKDSWDLFSYLSHQFTLLPGTIILTGTPDGVGCHRNPPIFLRPGGTITVEVEGIGALTNSIVMEE